MILEMVRDLTMIPTNLVASNTVTWLFFKSMVWTIGERNASTMKPLVLFFSVLNDPTVLHDRWLTGARDSENDMVYVRDHLGSSYELSAVDAYEWQVRSTAGDGSRSYTDPKHGECLVHGELVFLQVNGMDNRWLSGGRGSGNEGAITRNHLGSSYEINGVNSYRWIVRREAGNGDRSVSSPKRNQHGQLVGGEGAYLFQSYNELKSDYDACKAEANSNSDLDPDEKLQEHKDCLADHFNEPIGRSLELVFGAEASPGYICGIKDAVKK